MEVTGDCHKGILFRGRVGRHAGVPGRANENRGSNETCERKSFEQLYWHGGRKMGRDLKGPIESKNICFSLLFVCFCFLLSGSYLTIFHSHGNT